MEPEQGPARHYFQALLSGKVCPGIIYFPIVTALADSANMAGLKPCSGARFLIRKRIEKEFLIFCCCLSVPQHSLQWLPCKSKAILQDKDLHQNPSDIGRWRFRGARELVYNKIHELRADKETDEQWFVEVCLKQDNEPSRRSSRTQSARTRDSNKLGSRRK